MDRQTWKQLDSKHKTRRTLVAMATILLGAANAASYASDVDVAVYVVKSPTIYVESNGQKYTKLSFDKHGISPIAFSARLEIAGGQDRIKHWAVAPRVTLDGKTWGWSFDSSRSPDPGWGVVSKSYSSGHRPKNIDTGIKMNASQSFIGNFAVAACNTKADHLRQQGKGNTYIFGHKHTLTGHASTRHQLSYVNIADTDKYQLIEYTPESTRVNVICMKWGGAQVPTVGTDLQLKSHVTQASLTTIEQFGPSGLCKLKLSGVIQTNTTGTQVKFRYEHTNGKQSDVKTVTTDHSKTAMFSHDYNVPFNPNGDETGSVRIVGVGMNFHSNWSTYDMHCTKPGPQSVQAVTLPKLSMKMTASNNIMVDGQICPSRLLLDGTVHAGSAFNGKALFVGNAFLSPLHNVSLAANGVRHVFANRNLNWQSHANIGTTFSAPSGSAKPPLKSKKVRLGFNLADNDGKVVAQIKQKWFTITCKEPKRNPAVHLGAGGMTAQPRTAPRRVPNALKSK